MLVARLGASDFGRPRRTSLSPFQISARSNQSRRRRGASSGSVHLLFVIGFFVFMTVPHRNDAHVAATQCPDHDDEPVAQPTCRDETRLAVITAVIRQI